MPFKTPSCSSIVVLSITVLIVILTIIATILISLPRKHEALEDVQQEDEKEQFLVDFEHELKMSAIEVIKANGYPAENYTVETEDGYLLQLHRIPHGKHSQHSTKGVVFLMHGINCESSLFIDRLNNSLAFLLANAGFDVWLGNNRGNRYSEHKCFTVTDDDYWNFSWDEIARYDVPALLTYVMEKTKATGVYYGGISLGNAVGMMFLSSHPEWNEKIKGFLGILPVTRMTYSPWSRQRQLSSLYQMVSNYINFLEHLSHWPATDLIEFSEEDQVFLSHMPQENTLDFDYIRFSYKLIGYNPFRIPLLRERITLRHCTSGVSFKTVLHGAQITTSKELHHFDYGSAGNLYRYNSSLPPIYNFSRITVPVLLFTTENDVFANPLDVSRLIMDLPNVHTYYVHPATMFTHWETQSEADHIFMRKIAEVLIKMEA